MGKQFTDWIEKIVGKEEIARYEQFLLFPQCFQKLTVVKMSIYGLEGYLQKDKIIDCNQSSKPLQATKF